MVLAIVVRIHGRERLFPRTLFDFPILGSSLLSMDIETLDIGLDLPVVVMDEDFLDFLHENSVETIEVDELAIYFEQWLQDA